MRKIQQCVLQGIMLGFTAGFIITFFDGLYMFNKDLYIPRSYPVLLIVFNLLFWSVFGIFSGSTVCYFAREKEGCFNAEIVSWCLFFLAPFSLIYGFLSHLYLPIWGWVNMTTGKPVYDHHASFVWAGFIILSVCVYVKKRTWERPPLFIFFIPEITAIIILFQFCSHFSALSPIEQLLQSVQASPLIEALFYLLGVCCIGIMYGAVRTGFSWLIEKTQTRPKQAIFTGSLFACILISLAGFYILNSKNIVRSNIQAQHPVTGKAPAPQTIILIVLDTVRADRLSLYGGPVKVQHLENLAKDSLVFENSYATSPWTIPSHASLFTGLYPSEHGCHHDISSAATDIFGEPLPSPLSGPLLTLAEILGQRGYQTGAVAANKIVLDPELRLNKGFNIQKTAFNIGHIYQTCSFRPIVHMFSYITNIYPKNTLSYPTADDITHETIKVLSEEGSNPLFLFVNYMDAHEPYRPPSPYIGYYVNTRFPQLYRLQKFSRRFLTKRYNMNDWQKYQLTQYDGAIAFLDDQLGNLISYLKEQGLYDSSLLIITSDHGELFGTHGYVSHKTPMYEGVIRIPLIIKYPKNNHVGREAQLINLCDLHPTLLEICGLPIPENISGRPFGGKKTFNVAEYFDFKIGEHRMLYDGTYKYMSYSKNKKPELYDLSNDLSNDTDKLGNLAEKQPDISSAMELKIKEWSNNHRLKYARGSEKNKEKSEDLFKELRALGYIH